MKKIIFLLLLILTPFRICAEYDSNKEYFPDKTFSVFFENDTFFDTDREYTNGIRFSLAINDHEREISLPHKIVKKTAAKLGIGKSKNTRFAYSISFGQSIFTPEDTESKEIVEDDMPYSGITYISYGIIAKTTNMVDSFEIALGITGPHSYAEDVQKFIHEEFNWDKPKGWDNQLHDEPIAQIFYSRRWKAAKANRNGYSFDLIPEVSLGLGNAMTYIQSGINFRIGYNIPHDFGTPRIRPATEINFPFDKEDPRLFPKFKKFGIYMFLTATSEYTARDIVLDGNTFQSSHSVERLPITGTTTIGMGIIFNRFNLVYGYVFNSKSYEEQRERQSYGTMSLSYSW